MNAEKQSAPNPPSGTAIRDRGRGDPREWMPPADLERHFTPAQIIELVVTGGWCHTISFVLNAARVQLEPWAARLPVQ
jgi:hypothetical protein